MGDHYIPPEAGLGSPGPPAHGYPPEPRSEQDLIDAVNAALFLDPDLPTEQFEVTAENGVVFLHGVVRSEDERQRVLELARDVQGVRRVVDELFVRP
ncbi:MAG: BON domain-containing protein [Chloroflexi bacterium]|nr:BON domain-containing protein [Chloroflexota bacterium]